MNVGALGARAVGDPFPPGRLRNLVAASVSALQGLKNPVRDHREGVGSDGLDLVMAFMEPAGDGVVSDLRGDSALGRWARVRLERGGSICGGLNCGGSICGGCSMMGVAMELGRGGRAGEAISGAVIDQGGDAQLGGMLQGPLTRLEGSEEHGCGDAVMDQRILAVSLHLGGIPRDGRGIEARGLGKGGMDLADELRHADLDGGRLERKPKPWCGGDDGVG